MGLDYEAQGGKMKRLILIAIVVLAVGCGSKSNPAAPSFPMSSRPIASVPLVSCTTSLDSFVYTDERLEKSALGCVGVTGYIRKFALTKDGDLVIDFDIDEQFRNDGTYLNQVNRRPKPARPGIDPDGNDGYMVVEFICQQPGTWPPQSGPACSGFKGPKIDLDQINRMIAQHTHVRIVGRLVRDL